MKQIWTSTQYATKDIKHPDYLTHNIESIQMRTVKIGGSFFWSTTSALVKVYAFTEMKRLIHATKNYMDFGPW